MKTNHDSDRCYNTQAAVDKHSQRILDTEVSNNASDNQQLIPVIEAVQRGTGAIPDMILADAGYASEADFAALEQRLFKTLVLAAAPRTGSRRAAAGRFP